VNQTIEVDRERLLQTLIANRKKHKQTYRKAVKAYRERMVKELRKAADNIEAGGKVETRTVLLLPVPQSYLNEYDAAIEMMEWHTRDALELGQADFEQYVLDKWHWKNQFLADTKAYV
jgi:iron uptake system EfeUOB component EfeO/EfeM